MTFRTVCQLVLLVWLTCTATGKINFCRLIHGQCHVTCPNGLTTLSHVPILCPRASYCCLDRRPRSPPTTTRTTTPTTTTTPATVDRGCGIGISERIIGGVDAGRCEFPWIVHIYRDKSPCGGSLIDNRHIVTAGHCLSNVAKALLTITVGEYDTRVFTPRTEFRAQDYRIFLPPTYQSQYFKDDIAIIKLDRPINMRQYGCMSPICLPAFWRRFRNVHCTVIGWGVTRANYTYRDPPLSPILQKVTVDIVDDGICRRKFGNNYFRDTNYCAGDLNGGKDSCGGDSGGPLMCQVRDRNGIYRQVLAGLVSTGSNCAEKDTPAIYTDVAKYLDWINSVIETP